MQTAYDVEDELVCESAHPGGVEGHLQTVDLRCLHLITAGSYDEEAVVVETMEVLEGCVVFFSLCFFNTYFIFIDFLFYFINFFSFFHFFIFSFSGVFNFFTHHPPILVTAFYQLIFSFDGACVFHLHLHLLGGVNGDPAKVHIGTGKMHLRTQA